MTTHNTHNTQDPDTTVTAEPVEGVSAYRTTGTVSVRTYPYPQRGEETPRRTEYIEGEWCYPTHLSEPAAIVTYAGHPSARWLWWASGVTGHASTYSEACFAAEEALDALVAKMEEIGI